MTLYTTRLSKLRLRYFTADRLIRGFFTLTMFIINVTSGLFNDILNERCDWSHWDVNKLNPLGPCWESYSCLQGNNCGPLSHAVTLSPPCPLLLLAVKGSYYLSVHPDMVTIATGQVAGNSKDGKLLAPHVRVWDSVSLNTLHVIGMGVFDRAVTCVAFSKSCSNDSVLAAVFHPMDANLIVTCGKSHINFWTMDGNTLSKRQGLFEKHEKPKYVLCVAFAENGDAITGDSSGNIYIWAKGGNRISQVVSGAHEGGIFSICVLKDGTMVSGGGKDRKVVLWDHDYRKQAEMEGHTDELWGLDVHPSMEQFATCAQDKQVHLWDTNSHQPLWSKTIDDPGRSVGFHPSGAVLAVGTMTGRWLVLDTDTRDLVSMHTDGNEIISNVKYSPDGNFLAVASHDNFGHSSFVTHLDWSTDSQYLVTNSGDYEILFWEASSGKHVTNMDTVRNLEWATYTCTLGFNTFGIWPDGADGTDINAVCRSHDGSLLASADDFGKVHLFSFPCSQPRAPSHECSGHSSHVTNIAFLHDDSHLISTGGKDTSILQWTGTSILSVTPSLFYHPATRSQPLLCAYWKLQHHTYNLTGPQASPDETR
ncbi:hypothetical protein INR49_021271 [Caranx melampygus]|nr:hypothetical protein INR49_021271 [Caranx melampygus]